MHKVVNYCAYSRCWIVWDRKRKVVVGYFAKRGEALNLAAQLEMEI